MGEKLNLSRQVKLFVNFVSGDLHNCTTLGYIFSGKYIRLSEEVQKQR